MSFALSGLNPEEIAGALSLKPFQGRQIFRWIHQKKIFDVEDMTDVSKAVRARIMELGGVNRLELVKTDQSPTTGTKKVLLRLPDGETVEAVLIRGGKRTTLCVSSQVGCPLKCAFCATGAAGYTRNLDAAEIVEQALYLLRGEDLGDRTPNIVYMGMGEPMRNYDNVVKSIRLLMEPEGLHIGARKITVSTAGEVKAIERFAEESWQVRLSVSLHAADDALRDRLVPLNRKYPLARLREAIEYYIARTGRQITFEWTLLNEVNDRPEDVDALLRYMTGMPATVNLIPWNPVADLPFTASTPERCRAFRDALEKSGVNATLRQEKGQDIDAACGQLKRIHDAA